MRKLLFLITLTIVASSCSTVYKVNSNDQLINSIAGNTKSDIILMLGAPTSIVDYEGGYVMNFENNDRAFSFDRTIGLNPKLEVYMNDDNVCVATRVSNDSPVKKHSPGKTIGLILGIILLIGII